MHSAIRVGLIGDFNRQQKAHHAIPKALAGGFGARWNHVWVSTDSVGNGESLAEFDGLWCVPGMPYRIADGAIAGHPPCADQHTLSGHFGGFQYALIEFARHVLGLVDADHQKSNPKAAMPLISPLACGLAGVKAA